MFGTARIASFLWLTLWTVPVCAGSWQGKVLLFDRAQSAKQEVNEPLIGWAARIEYGVTVDASDAPASFARGDERGWSKAVFATLQRRFPNQNVTPYLGLGAGYAEGLVTAPSEVERNALAFKGVLGTELALARRLGTFVEYSFAVSPRARTGPRGSLRSHALNTGLKLDLN